MTSSEDSSKAKASKASEDKPQHSRFTKHQKSLLCGGIAGACAKTVIAPFERIKLLFVTRDRTFKYSEALKETKYIVKNHGVKNLWRGNSANLLRIFPFASINFSTFDYLRKTYYNPFPNDNKLKKKILLFSVGSISGVVAQSICYPFEFLRTRLAMQRDNFRYRNFNDAVKTIYKAEGIQGFYSGLCLAMIGVVFYHGSGFFLVTSMKVYAKENYASKVNKWYADFLFGAIGATISQLISYPFDVMRKRKQAQSLLVSTGEQTHKMTYKEIMHHYIKKEGYIPTFYKGITMNLIKGPLSSGTAWMVKNQLNRRIDSSYDL